MSTIIMTVAILIALAIMWPRWIIRENAERWEPDLGAVIYKHATMAGAAVVLGFALSIWGAPEMKTADSASTAEHTERHLYSMCMDEGFTREECVAQVELILQEIDDDERMSEYNETLDAPDPY